MNCIKNTYCLNKKDGRYYLLDYVNNILKDKTSTGFKNYSFFLDSKNLNHQFKFTCVYSKDNTNDTDKKELNIYIYTKGNKSFCLKLRLLKKKKHTEFTNFYGFKESYIYNINSGLCSINKGTLSKNMTGTYLIKLVDRINTIFQVEKSSLSDDSRLELKKKDSKELDLRPSLKVIKLFEYGKTWYQKEGDFKPIPIEINQFGKDAGKLTLKELYNYYMDESIRKFGIDEQLITNKKIEDTINILKKLDLDENSNLKKIATSFKSKNIKDWEKIIIWDNVFNLTTREKILNSKDLKYKNIQAYLILLKYHLIQVKSVKNY